MHGAATGGERWDGLCVVKSSAARMMLRANVILRESTVHNSDDARLFVASSAM